MEVAPPGLPLRHTNRDGHGPPVGDVLRDEAVAFPGTASHVLDYGKPATESPTCPAPQHRDDEPVRHDVRDREPSTADRRHMRSIPRAWRIGEVPKVMSPRSSSVGPSSQGTSRRIVGPLRVSRNGRDAAWWIGHVDAASSPCDRVRRCGPGSGDHAQRTAGASIRRRRYLRARPTEWGDPTYFGVPAQLRNCSTARTLR